MNVPSDDVIRTTASATMIDGAEAYATVQLNRVPTAAGTVDGHPTTVRRPCASSDAFTCEATAAVDRTERVATGAGAAGGAVVRVGVGLGLGDGVRDGVGEGLALALALGEADAETDASARGDRVGTTRSLAERSADAVVASVPSQDRRPRTPPASSSRTTTATPRIFFISLHL